MLTRATAIYCVSANCGGSAAFHNGSTFSGGQMWSLVAETRVGLDNRTEALPMQIDAQYTAGFSWASCPSYRSPKLARYVFRILGNKCALMRVRASSSWYCKNEGEVYVSSGWIRRCAFAASIGHGSSPTDSTGHCASDHGEQYTRLRQIEARRQVHGQVDARRRAVFG